MAFKNLYRAQVFNQGAAGASLINLGYTPTPAPAVGLVEPVAIDSEGKAISEALSLVRRFQSVGIDAVAEVWGMPIDLTVGGQGIAADPSSPAVPATPEYVLAGDELAEHLYANIDAPSPGLRQRINANNRDQAANNFAPYLAANADPA